MSIQKGRAVVFDVDGITFTAGIVSANTAHFNQSARLERNGDVARIRNGEGNEAAHVFYNRKKTLTVTVIPCSLSGTNTIANAIASADGFTAQPGTAVTVVDADGSIIDATYNLISATQSRTNTDAASIDLTLEQSDEGIDLTAAVS